MRLKLVSFARASTRAVLPVPGAPYNRIPDLNRNGHLANKLGYWKIKQVKDKHNDFQLKMKYK